ncbi:MAG: amino acid transporter [Thiothrix sp.]|nr:amino acid transporter [Thiothrix sp.]HPQ95145.1 LysE/ArgO family amino acid transporter [Thiolinea sp.]
MESLAILKGFGVGAGLIIAIGAQNAFVLSCALRNQHAWLVAGICILIDIILITAGVWGLGSLIQRSSLLLALARWGGAAFLFLYGLLAFRRALQPESLNTERLKPLTARTAVLTATGISLLNPHVYLDTVVLLGSIGGQLPGKASSWFALGAYLASISWFLGLVWGGRRLAPWFADPRSWRYLDMGVGVVMWSIALSLVLGG